MKRSVVALMVLVLALAWALTSVVVPAAPVSAVLAAVPASGVSAPGGFTSVSPFRLLDTGSGVGVAKGSVAGRDTVHLQVTGRGGVPASGVSAVVLSMTVTEPTKGGYVSVYPTGTVRPRVSNLNYLMGGKETNVVVAPVGANGMVDLYNGSPGTFQLIADVSGYYVSGAPTAAGAFGSVAPSRVLDTREGLGAPQAAVEAGGTVHLKVAGAGGVPASGVSAVVLNVTVNAPTQPGFVSADRNKRNLPGASNLSFPAARTIPNLVVAPVGADGSVDLHNGSSGTIQLIADLSGYYLAGAPTVAGAIGLLTPSRLLDTGLGVGVARGPLSVGSTVHLKVAGAGGVPASGVSAVLLNVKTTGSPGPGSVSVYADGTAQPAAPNIYFASAQTVVNLVIAPVGGNGKVALHNGQGGPVQLSADVVGYYKAPDGATAISTGTSHSCAVTTAGKVTCWGSNSRGELGDGTTDSSSLPVDVVGLRTGVSTVSAGLGYTCAVTSARGVRCWGYNGHGELGSGTTDRSEVPIDVVGLDNPVVALSAGWSHSCAVTAGGAVKCWGKNAFGELGNGTTTSSAVPVDVIGLSSGVVAVEAGQFHTCAVTSAGAVKCWGYNADGELGNADTANSAVPVDVVGLGADVNGVSAGKFHSCAVTSAGAVKCWGHDPSGELGNGTTTDSAVPVGVLGLGSGAVAVSAGWGHSCAVTSSGVVKCWGGRGGELGNGATTASTVPVKVAGLGSGAAAVSAGGHHSCARTAAGSVKCWGYNGNGELGAGTATKSIVPVGVVGLG